ncbi:MAG: DUF5723 family protein [Flavobacteriales bacterium]
MSRGLLFVSCSLLVRAGVAQVQSLPHDSLVDLDRHWGHHIRLTSSADYNANTVYNEMPWNIYLGEYLDRDMRTRSLDDLSYDRNTTGYVIEGRLEWTGPACLKKLSGWRPIISLGHHDIRGARFTKDQYALTFFGNAAYEGARAVLAPSGYTQINYQTLGAGVQHQRSGSFVRADIVRGHTYAALDVHWASLFTSTDGRELRMAFLGDYQASDTAGTGFGRTNGLGLAVSGEWKTHFRAGAKRVDVGVGIADLGFVQWSKNSVRIDQDTSFTYTGWEVANIFDLDAVDITDSLILDTLGLRYENGGFATLLPFSASLEFSTTLGRTGYLGLALDQRNIVGYQPHVSVLGSRRFGHSTQLGLSASYGGFGVLRFGIAAKQRVGEQVLLHFSSPNVSGFFMGNARGAGAMLGMDVVF